MTGRALKNKNSIEVDNVQYDLAIDRIYKKYEKQISITGCFKPNNVSLNGIIDVHHICPIGENVRILSTGDVYPCQILSDPKYIIGNIYDDSLCDIVRSNKMEKLCSLLQSRLVTIPKCKKCKFLYFCGCGCIAESENIYGTVNHEAWNCNLKYTEFEKLLLL